LIVHCDGLDVRVEIQVLVLLIVSMNMGGFHVGTESVEISVSEFSAFAVLADAAAQHVLANAFSTWVSSFEFGERLGSSFEGTANELAFVMDHVQGMRSHVGFYSF
jgi:hypothetical protein